ncbi:MAG: hypothetical protein WC975_10370, partial [Phycisphaerae bacterium]
QKVFCLCDPQSFVRKSYPITENIMAQVLLKIRITRHFMRLPWSSGDPGLTRNKKGVKLKMNKKKQRGTAGWVFPFYLFLSVNLLKKEKTILI